MNKLTWYAAVQAAPDEAAVEAGRPPRSVHVRVSSSPWLCCEIVERRRRARVDVAADTPLACDGDQGGKKILGALQVTRPFLFLYALLRSAREKKKCRRAKSDEKRRSGRRDRIGRFALVSTWSVG